MITTTNSRSLRQRGEGRGEGPISCLVALLLCACATTSPSKSETIAAPPPPAITCPTSPPQPSDETPPWGTRVTKLCLLGASDDDALRFNEIIAPREGEPLTADAVAADLRELISTELLGDAQVFAQRLDAERVMLIYAVTPYPLVGAITVEGAQKADTGALRDAALKTGWASPVRLKNLQRELEGQLHELGFNAAAVTVTTKPVGAKVDVHVAVVEGPLDTLKTIAFTGHKRGKEAELRKTVKSALNQPWRGDASADVQALELHYFDRGMVNARINFTTARATSGDIALTFTITEGDVFSVGTLKLRGDALGPEKPLLASLTSKPGRVFSRSVMRDDVQKLEARGDVVVTPIVDVDPKTKRINVTFEVAPK